MATYQIKIIDETSGGGSGGGQQATGQGSGGANAQTSKTLVSTISKVWSSTALLRTGINATAEIINRGAGNSQLQARYNAVTGMINQGIGVGLAFATGGIYGGGMALAAVGISFIKEAEQTSYNKRWESYGLQEQYRRAGTSFNRSRL